MRNIANFVKHRMTDHRQGPEKNIFIFSTARSGTTWLAEMLATQGRFKIVNEPFNLRVPVIRDNLRITSWNDLFNPDKRPFIQDYIESFINGNDRDLRFKRETPFSRRWHYRTDRIIFKILFAGEDSINWFRDQFNGHVILLLRHPIPVARSRNEFPRLESFLQSSYSDNFTPTQLAYAQSVLEHEDKLQIAVLDWCLQNAVPLRCIADDWIVISYEQLVLQPELIIKHLAGRLCLRSVDKMMRQIYTASGSTGHSTVESRRVLLNPDEIRRNRKNLIKRWREFVSDAQEARAFETLQRFGIDYYEYGRDVPADKYWLRANQG